MKYISKLFCVAQHIFAVRLHDAISLPDTQYGPFAVTQGNPLFTIDIYKGSEETLGIEFTEETRQDSFGQTFVSGSTADGRNILSIFWDDTKALLVSDENYTQSSLYVTGRYSAIAIDCALKILFAFKTVDFGTLAFHASTVVDNDRAFLFLGVSGTGKSTHSRLWLKNIPGTWLLNDDHPIVRITDDGSAVAFGSPWSGKTPCYKADSRPIGAIVQLSQHKENVIRRLSAVEAYVDVINSIAGKRWEHKMADKIHDTAERLVKNVKFWHLACLPDDEAAILCHKTVCEQWEK